METLGDLRLRDLEEKLWDGKTEVEFSLRAISFFLLPSKKRFFFFFSCFVLIILVLWLNGGVIHGLCVIIDDVPKREANSSETQRAQRQRERKRGTAATK